jgi:hypothetical protein
MNPEQLAKSGTEHGHQRAFFAWVNMAAKYGFVVAHCMDNYALKQESLERGLQEIPQIVLPVLSLELMFAIPNGGLRDKVQAAKLKAEGVKPGVSDIMWPVPVGSYHGLFIELKNANGRASPEQLEFINAVRSYGYCAAVASCWFGAANLVIDYQHMNLREGRGYYLTA